MCSVLPAITHNLGLLSPGLAVVTFSPANNTNSTTATAGHGRQEKQEEWMLKVVLFYLDI